MWMWMCEQLSALLLPKARPRALRLNSQHLKQLCSDMSAYGLRLAVSVAFR